MARKLVANLQAALVLLGAGAIWYFLPDEYFELIAVSILLAAIAGVFGIKAYLRRLHALAATLEDTDDRIRLIRTRQSIVTEAGVFLAIIGLSAFIAMIVAYAD